MDSLEVTKESTLKPGFHSNAERDGNFYSLTVTKEGWSFIARPSRTMHPIFDDKPNLLAKKEKGGNIKRKKAAREKEDKLVVMEVVDPDDLLVLVNKEWRLPAEYVPSDLVVPKVRFGFQEIIPKRKCEKRRPKH